MAQIEFIRQGKAALRASFKVKHDGRVAGAIKPDSSGQMAWQYFPKGSEVGGPVFGTIEACMRDVAGGTSYKVS